MSPSGAAGTSARGLPEPGDALAAVLDDVIDVLGDVLEALRMSDTAQESRAEPRHAPPGRVAQMYEEYEAGASLAAVGASHGLTRERVRQLFAAADLPTRSNSGTAKLRQAHLADRHRDRIVAEFAQGSLPAMIAERLALPRKLVETVLAEDPRRARVMRVTARRAVRRADRVRVTDDELVACLQQAAEEIGGIVAAERFDRIARQSFFADGRSWASHQTYAQRFGSWRAALQHAGLPANPPSPIAGRRRFTRQHCVDAILEVERAIGHLPTSAEYDDYARATAGELPSVATVRQRLDGWTEAVTTAAGYG